MKTNLQRVCFGMVLVLLAACEGKPDPAQQAKAAQALAGKIAEIASQMNRAASAAVDPNTRLDGAKAGPGLTLTIDYTLVNSAANGINDKTFDTLTAPVVKQGSCANSALREIIDQGAQVVLEYRDLKGGALGSVSVDSRVCSALSSAPAASN